MLFINGAVLLACLSAGSAPLLMANAAHVLPVASAKLAARDAATTLNNVNSIVASFAAAQAPTNILVTPAKPRLSPEGSSDTSSGLVRCKSSAECKAIDKNGVCAKPDKLCECKSGYFWDGDRCAKLTQKICDAVCADVDPHAVCDVAELSCMCDPRGWRPNATGDGCDKYTKAECDADCRDQAAGYVCHPTDYRYCRATQ